MLRTEAVTSRMPMVCPAATDDSKGVTKTLSARAGAMRCDDATRWVDNCQTSWSRRRRKAVQAGLEAIFARERSHPLVVEGRVRVDPIALRVDSQGEDLRHVGALEQHLLPWDEAGQQVQLHLI